MRDWAWLGFDGWCVARPRRSEGGEGQSLAITLTADFSLEFAYFCFLS